MTEITLLDGGMGQELIRRHGKPPTPLWATHVMIENPGLVREIHADYFAAGATIATSNSYAILRDRLPMGGLEDEFEALLGAALSEAKAARDAHGSGRIAGSIGPLGGSYRPDNHPDEARATATYAENVAFLAPRVDMILYETASVRANIRSAMAAAKGCGVPVWIGVSVDDQDGTRLRSGEALADALPDLADADAVLINCSAPEAMPQALRVLSEAGKPYGAYANGFTQITKEFMRDEQVVDALSARRDMGPQIYADHVMRWIDQGATIVGGCCETGPDHIAEIARRLRARGVALT